MMFIIFFYIKYLYVFHTFAQAQFYERTSTNTHKGSILLRTHFMVPHIFILVNK